MGLADDWEYYRKQTFTVLFLFTAIPLIIFNHSNLNIILESMGISALISVAMAYADFLRNVALIIFVFLLLFIPFLVVFVLIGAFLDFTNFYVIMGLAVVCDILTLILVKHRQMFDFFYTLRYRKYYTYEQPYDAWEEAEAFRDRSRDKSHHEAERLRELYRNRHNTGNTENISSNIPSTIKSVEEAYTLFNLTSNATNKEVKNAYRRLTKLFHPDKTLQDTNREMQTINEAYDLIRQARKA